jgi:uncharacterized protein (DUF2235 family)
MTNLIVCCDGTWNTADDREAGVPSPTNVVKIFNAIEKAENGGLVQRAYYHPGVGTEGSKLDKFMGGAVGDGLEKNNKSAYKWLAQNYRAGDNIYIFGFSRGAYTARYVAGIICSYGLTDFSTKTPTDDVMWQQVDRVFEACRNEAKPQSLSDLTFFHTPPGESPQDRMVIHFLGVWDTVGSLGIPDDLALLNLLDGIGSHQFRNTQLSNNVHHARHAVAIDERRQSFTPTLWDNIGTHPDAKQIWFSGVHSDVGGGYLQAGLSDIALKWMMDEAQAKSLVFRRGIEAQISPNPRGTLHDSNVGVFSALRSLPRSVPLVSNGGANKALLHDSVIERWSNPPIEQSPYWEGKILPVGGSTSIDVFAREHWNATGLYLEKDAEYSFEATGQWMDGSITCDASGTQSEASFIGQFAQMAGYALGKAEKLYQELTGNAQADFWWSKRIEEYEWFSLVGVIANGMGTDVHGDPAEHEVFKIGNKLASYRPKEGGYLYCFANDAWQAYRNNRGSVRLVVKREK